MAAMRACYKPPARPPTDLQLLAAHLLKEAARGAESFWAPYIRSLPPSYTTAMCFTEEEAAAAAAASSLEQLSQPSLCTLSGL